MKFFNKKISTSFEAAKQNIQNKFDSERIQMVEISKLKFDKDFKELFAQEPEKVERIAQDMKKHGFDKSQPIIATKDGSILDGNSRFIAANQVGIKYLPVVYKNFVDKNEALKYELHLQLDRRNLSDAEVFAMFKKLEGMKQNAKAEGKSTEDFTDAKIAEQLKKSERSVQKIRELSKKADKQTLDKVASGELSINKALSEVKKAEHPITIKSNANSSINKSEFIKGIKFALNEIANGKNAEEILAAL
ncbi:putative transcriptional regulator [Treponema sp. JC4]|uniref:ParB/RepB/Spo0J family partition protein n=1 Tax=Treponema sp. JC4 TaxID=1124982 RepID=UPI00025B0344|nr:ParB N-terminal domain-containing protein [Treponema sp. JC4]EID84291.1 putative transcriptional regulator [Treponema sp. JC4]